MGEYRSLGLIIAATFVLLGLGVWFSPTYTQKMGYAEAIVFGGSVLFIAAVVILVAAAGFRTFSLYLAVLMGMAIMAFGPMGGLLVLGLTYVVWGFVFAMQLLLVLNDVDPAIRWFRHYYTYPMFLAEYRLFYPMLWLVYILLEVIPHLIDRERMMVFDPHRIPEAMKKHLKKHR